MPRGRRSPSDRTRRCYESALRSNPNLSGKVTVSFTIAGDGHVQSASASSTVPDPSVGPCVAQQFYSLSFPPPEGGGTVKVTYPIAFAAG
ncbi:MAG: AgmX/PglI C-terminal domain-containing protein [Myxococcales bacterium]|nr:AgmX/PglI C-terminal domain-containing protein [Myxococcales bacterium]